MIPAIYAPVYNFPNVGPDLKIANFWADIRSVVQVFIGLFPDPSLVTETYRVFVGVVLVNDQPEVVTTYVPQEYSNEETILQFLREEAIWVRSATLVQPF
jgi:hypothetical protein